MADKTRAHTLQEKLGFADKDLTTPAHDEIMLWLDANIKTICNQIVKIIVGVPDHDYAVIAAATEADVVRLAEEWNDPLLPKFQDWRMPPHPGPNCTGICKTWEYPVRTDTGYVIGFIDMKVKTNYVSAEIDDSSYKDRAQNHGGKGYFPWWIEESLVLLFEVKSAIPSLGELVRQIHLYQMYERDRYVVVSPDQRWTEALKQQGILFLPYTK